VPLVELKTTNSVPFYTDSNGVVALDEPGFMNRKVFFHVASHGYEFPADGFGQRGTALDVTPGGRATLKIKRLNIAERLYRVTGEGIYRDSLLAGGFPVPIREPLLNAQVTGQDSIQAAIYHGKIYWMWGDTNRLRYPLGHFWMSGATSDLPGKGGLDPAKGVDLKYFVDDEGFARGMFEPVHGPVEMGRRDDGPAGRSWRRAHARDVHPTGEARRRPRPHAPGSTTTRPTLRADPHDQRKG
jgi:hypothetical protein